MGVCMTKFNLTKNKKKKTKERSVEMLQSPLTYMPDGSQFVELREKMASSMDYLQQLQQMIENQAKSFMSKHKRGRSIFALKRFRLYTILSEELHIQAQRLDQAILGQGMNLTEGKKVYNEALNLLVFVNETTELETSLKPGEDLKHREDKYKALFKRYNIHNPDIYPLFAKYEAEVNDITLTTSFVFQKSEVKTQPSSQDFLDS